MIWGQISIFGRPLRDSSMRFVEWNDLIFAPFKLQNGPNDREPDEFGTAAIHDTYRNSGDVGRLGRSRLWSRYLFQDLTFDASIPRLVEGHPVKK